MNTLLEKESNNCFLVIDAGNTTTNFGICSPESIIQHFRLPSDAAVLRRETPKMVEGKHLSGVLISSVVPQLKETLSAVCGRIHSRTVWLTYETPHGLALQYKNPAEIGPDRIANVAAAKALYGTPAIVVDIGTAVTFDCISTRGAYLGGVIAPGPKLTRAALAEKTGLLPYVEIKVPPDIIGKSTIHAIQAGMIFGSRVLIEGLVEQLARKMKSKPKIIFTGGQLEVIVQGWDYPKLLNPLLTLEGLRIIYNTVCSI